MNKQEFDKWFTDNYEIFVGKLSKQYHQTTEQIREDLSDFYIHIVEGQRLHKVQDFKGYLFSFIFYRHHKFYAESKSRREGYLVNGKRLSIKLSEDILQYDCEDPSEDYIVLEETLQELEGIVKKLPLDDQILYDLRYVKGMKIQEIGNLYGLQKPWISKKLKRLREKIKECMN